MRRWILGPRAEADLSEIAAYVAQGGNARATVFVERFGWRCRKIALFPEGARVRPELGPGVRLVPFGNYLIIYVVRATHLEVVRIIHGARDTLAALDADE